MKKLSDVFLWGKLGSDGSVIQHSNTRFTTAKASSVIVPKIYYIEELLGEHTQAGENLSYLIRDLNPEYEMQQGNFDYFSRELKKVQDYITAKNEEE